jgi:hypothetical protein
VKTALKLLPLRHGPARAVTGAIVPPGPLSPVATGQPELHPLQRATSIASTAPTACCWG